MTEETINQRVAALTRERAGYEARERVAVERIEAVGDAGDIDSRRRLLEFEFERDQMRRRAGEVDEQLARLGVAGKQTRERKTLRDVRRARG